MRVIKLLTTDRAVSPVIGVILMVAITVILAAVIGTFVLGLGSNVEARPQTSFGYDFNDTTKRVDISHRGGDNLDVGDNTGTVEITATAPAASTVTWAGPGANDTITTGDTWKGYDYATDGTTVRVVWTSPNNETSATLGQETAPS